MGILLKTTVMTPLLVGWVKCHSIEWRGGRRTVDNHSSQFFQSHNILRASSKLLLRLACPYLDHLGNRLIRATSLVWLHRLPLGQETPYQAGLGLMGNILGLIFLGFWKSACNNWAISLFSHWVLWVTRWWQNFGPNLPICQQATFFVGC